MKSLPARLYLAHSTLLMRRNVFSEANPWGQSGRIDVKTDSLYLLLIYRDWDWR